MDKSRGIRFRGMDLNGKWHYGDLVHLDDGCIIIEEHKLGFQKPDFEVVCNNSVCRYTGRRDDNCKYIYEGDFLKCWTKTYILEVCYSAPLLVEYDSSKCMFVLRDNKYKKEYKFSDFDEFYVVGNFYDNPELFKNE